MIQQQSNRGTYQVHTTHTKIPQRHKKLKIKYNGSSDARLIRYSDLDWGENQDDRHSTSGHVFLMANGAISWASQ